MPQHTDNGLPIPFYDDPWRGDKRQAAHDLWEWHFALAQAKGAFRGNRPMFYEKQALKVEAGESPAFVPAGVSRAAFEACKSFGLERGLLADQLRATRFLELPTLFPDAATLRAFSDQWVGSHGRLLAGLAGAKGQWQRSWIEHLAFGFFMTGRLVRLPDDLSSDRVFLPLSDLERGGVSVVRLREGVPDESVRKVLWKQVVRAREALAQGRPLIDELDRRYARALRRWWHGALAVLNEVERRNYDVWSRPLRLTPSQRFRTMIRATVGRSVFRWS